MIEKRKFLTELYLYRVSGGSNEIPFIEYFQKDKALRNDLYCSYLNHIKKDSVIKHLSQVESIKILKNIADTIRDFDGLVLTKSEYSPAVYAEVFAKDITAKLEKIGLPKLTKAILTDFVEKMESMEIEAESIVWRNEYEFAQKFGVSVDGAKRKYRELKRYADNYLNQFCDKMKVNSKTTKPTNESKNKYQIDNDSTDITQNPHPDIFEDYKASQLFYSLHELKKNEANILVEYSFIYRMMHSEKLIKDRIRPEMFRKWLLQEPFEIDTEYKLKTLANCSTKNKMDTYNLQKKVLGITSIP